MKKFILPAFLIVAGAGAAFATQTDRTATVVQGYRFDDSQVVKCIPVQECSTIPNVECTWNSEVLHAKINDTMCGQPLYKVH